LGDFILGFNNFRELLPSDCLPLPVKMADRCEDGRQAKSDGDGVDLTIHAEQNDDVI
jgi:hypothetical protein